MKRILSLILALTVALSAFTVFAEETEQTFEVSAQLQSKVDLLKAVGIVDKEFNVTNGNITRGEFTSLLIKAKGMQNFVSETTVSAFSDVTAETPYAAEINMAKEMKLISGYSDGTFRPENTISVFEAAICVIRALGYGVKAEGMGGYPNGYYSVITETKLLKNIGKNYNANLTVDSAVELIFNALHTMVMLQTGTEGIDGIYEVKSGETLLKTAFGIHYVDGIVNGVDISNLYGKNDLAPKSVYIGDVSYYSGEFPMNDMLGYRVRAYYKEELSHLIIKYAYVDERNSEVIVPISDIVSISNGTVVTEDEMGKEKKFTYKTSAPVIYNGTNTGEKFTTEIYKDEDGNNLSGEVKLLDNNGDETADVVIIDAYEEMIVGKLDIENDKVLDLNDITKVFTLPTTGNEPYVVMVDMEGEELDVSRLTRGTSLVIYRSKDDAHQDYIKVYASYEEVTGKIESVEKDNNGTFITIGKNVYKLSQYAKNTSLISGRSVRLTLNAKGEVAMVEYTTDPGDYTASLLVAAWKEKKFEGTYKMTLMDTSGARSTVVLKNKVKVDGNVYNLTSDVDSEKFVNVLKTASEAAGFTRREGYYYQIIKYGTDSNGLVNFIDTVLDSEKNKMNITYKDESNELYSEKLEAAEYIATTSLLGEQVIISADTVVFMVPKVGEESEESQYGVKDKSYFVHDEDYDMVYFNDEQGSYEAKYLINEYKRALISGEIKLAYVTKTTEYILPDETVGTKLYLYQRSGTLTAFGPKNFESNNDSEFKLSDLAQGDLIAYKTNADGEIEQYAIYYDRNTVDENGNPTDKVYPNGNTFNNKVVKAHVVNSTAKGIRVIYESAMGGATKLNDQLVAETRSILFNNLVYGVTVIDTRTMQARPGSYLDIIGYLENPDDYSVVIAHSGSGSDTLTLRQLLRELFLYK